MSTNSHPTNVQAGIPLGPGADDTPDVATGDRRDEVHYERDPDQLLKVRATFKPDEPLPPEEHSANTDVVGAQAVPPVQDVAVVAPRPSVWDARPPEDDKERSGNPTGH
jgi:hypothetical protein